MTRFRLFAAATLVLGIPLAPGLGALAWAQADFYKGKQVRIVVGLSAGGGYDRSARLLARF